MRALALLVLIACGEAEAQTAAAKAMPRGCRDRSCSRARSAGASEPAFSLFTEYSFALPGRLPISIDTVGLVALCRVNGAGSAWECVDSAGATLGTVTQGTGTTYQDTILGVKAMSDVTSAKAPHVVSTALDPIWKSDHTLVMGGYGTTLTDANFQHFFEVFDGTNELTVRNESGALNCIYSGAGGTRVANNATPLVLDGFAVFGCRRSGNNHYARVNGLDSVAAAGASISGNVTAGSSYQFGDRLTAGLPSRGPFVFAAFYSVAKTDAQLKKIESGFWGLDSRVTSLVGTGKVCLDVDGGQNDCYMPAAGLVGTLGLRTIRSRLETNLWAADNTAAATWTDVATPTVTSNVTPGPFFRWRNTNECDLIVDDNAAAFEGKKGASGYQASPTNGFYTASCYLAAGTSGVTTTKARLQIDVTGGGWPDAGTQTTCDVTGLTSTVARQTCVTPLFMADAGSPTVRGSVLVGNALAETGSITTCQCQLSAANYAGVPITHNTLLGDSSTSIDTTTDAWPTTTRGGKYEVVFRPLADHNADWVSQSDTLYLFDSHDSTPEHGVVMLFGYNTSGHAMARTESGGQQTEFGLDGVTLIPGQLYAVSMEWRPDGAGHCTVKWRWNECSGSVATCSATALRGQAGGGVCPAQPTETRLGNRFDNSVPTDVFISAVRVFSL